MKIIDRIALILVIVGALNWGSVGFFAFDCVAWLFGGQLAAVSRVIYALVGLAGLWWHHAAVPGAGRRGIKTAKAPGPGRGLLLSYAGTSPHTLEHHTRRSVEHGRELCHPAL